MIDHLDDLEADFLRFYRIEDISRLDGPRFFRLAWRVSAYGGVMQMRLEQQQPQHHPSTSVPAASPAASQSDVDHVSLTGFMLKFPGVVEHVKVPKDGPADV